jgi:hypothetical protein
MKIFTKYHNKIVIIVDWKQTIVMNPIYLIKNDLMVLDGANVCGVLGKSEQAKRLLALFYNFELVLGDL